MRIMKFPPHAVALIVVAATVLFLMLAGWDLITILGSNDWCPAVAQAGGAGDRLTACLSLLTLQVHAVSIVAYIVLGAISLIALFLVVVVLAAGRLSLKVNAQGADVNINAANSTDGGAVTQG